MNFPDLRLNNHKLRLISPKMKGKFFTCPPFKKGANFQKESRCHRFSSDPKIFGGAKKCLSLSGGVYIHYRRLVG